MRTLYIDCSMGAAGDMLAAALLELTDEPGAVLKRLSPLKRTGIELELKKTVKNGISASCFEVRVNGEQEGEGHSSPHRGIVDVESIIDGLDIGEKAARDAKNVYRLIAEAEAKVHGCELENIHFHELGTLDAIADVVTVCVAFDCLAPERVCASPVHVGSGTVKCAHGLIPVPAPATAELLCGVPTYSDGLAGELCTPTGAALLKYFVDSFGAMPQMRTEKMGIGAGKKDFDRPNCLRAMLGEAEDEVIELVCNVDDMSGEDVGFALETFMAQGALDAWWQPIGMKKSRPGMLLGLLCRAGDRERMLELIFRHTSTIGVREALCERYILKRAGVTLETPYGKIRGKRSVGYGADRIKAELDELARIAENEGVSLDEVRKTVRETD